MKNERVVRLFRNGRNQAVRIPRDLELPGNEAVIRKEGTTLVLVPRRKPSLLAVLRTLKPLDDDEAMDPIEDLPAEDVDL
jgi:antitoxin VapB